MTPDDYRSLALSFPDAEESTHMGHPDFRIGGKIFATLWKNSGVLLLTREQQASLTRAEPDVFAPAAGGWGNKGSTTVRLELADKKSVREAMSIAYGNKAPKEKQTKELFIFGRFHARPGNEDALSAAMLEVRGPSLAEPGCLFLEFYQSTRDPRLFFLHSRWKDEAAFNIHAELSHTERFLARAESLIDHELDVNRTRLLQRRSAARKSMVEGSPRQPKNKVKDSAAAGRRRNKP